MLPSTAAIALEAGRYAEESISLKPNWLAYRLQALLSTDTDAAIETYMQAWQMGDAPPELAIEIAQYLMTAGRPAELRRFVEALPPAIQDHERIVLARAVVAADARAFDELERLLFSRQFATIREGETLLSDLWIKPAARTAGVDARTRGNQGRGQ